MLLQENELFPWLAALLAAVLLLFVGVLLLWQKVRFQSRELFRTVSDSKSRIDEALQAQSVSVAELSEKERFIASLEAQVQQLEKQLSASQGEVRVLALAKEEFLQLQARMEEKEAQIESKEQIIEESKKTLLKEFELAANKLYESKQQSFTQSSKQNLETVLAPFREQLKGFNKQVEEVYHKENTQRNQLIGQIGELQKQAKQISEDANNLASALKGDNKAQGQWGEIILERLLEQSGLEKGREYETQGNYKNEEGKNYRPDVIIHLPEEKDIVIDSKVTLVEYERYANEADEDSRARSLKAHVESVRTHMKGLSLKKYEQLEGIKTLDFVFMFIPIEAAYVAAVQSAPNLFKEAYEKNIMVVSPSSLMVALRTVETMWRYEKQNANAEKIAISAGRLYDQFVLVLAALDDVGNYINKAGQSYETVINRVSQGRGNVLKRIDDLKKLGAKASKQLPKTYQDQIENDAMDLPVVKSVIESDVKSGIKVEE